VQLTSFSDYALRLGIYLGAERGRWVAVAEVSQAYGISRAHLVKVVQRLVELGLVEAMRGRGGGLRLARPPEAIGIGALSRATEPHLDIVECFDRKTNTCPIAPACALKHILAQARDQFLASLDRHTLADLLAQPHVLSELWAGNLRRRPAI
jgi:Rrf2 family transcriptional regulator, nitric oxide-sensitive transcriptional repressor